MKNNKHSTFYVAAIVSLGGFLFGFDASVISGVVRFVVPQFGLNDLQTGLDQHAWRWMLGIEMLPALVWLSLLTLAPESPRWLALKGRYEEARLVLSKLRPAERIESELEEIKASLGCKVEAFGVRFNAIFRPAMRLPLMIGLILAIAQQVTGINAIYFYAPTIFEQSGVGTNAAFAQATLIGIINIVFTLLAMSLIDRLGRRPLLLMGVAGVVISTALVGYGFNQATYQLTIESLAALPAEINPARLQFISIQP